MKYIMQPQTAILNSEGLTTSAGWLVVYHVYANTGEYSSPSYQYLPVGVGLPADSYADAPDEVDEGHAIVRQGDKWTYPVDYRGRAVYSTESGVGMLVTAIGDIPEGFTLLKPSSEFDSWDGEKWVLDKEKQHQHDVAVAQSKQSQLLREVNAEIVHLQDAVDAEIATEQQVELLKKLKGYRFKLNQIDFDKAPNIDWSEKPE